MTRPMDATEAVDAEERAHRFLQNAQTRFAQRPQAPNGFVEGTTNDRGHFYFAKNGDISISP